MVAGYTRQAAANIQPGLRCNAEDVNAEYNQLATAFDNTAGHDHTGSVAGDGAKISLTASVTGVLPVANGGTGSSTSPPTLTAINVNPGGVLVGAAGTVPGAGAMLLNENTVAPPALSISPNLWVAGANGTQAEIVLDSFGTPAGGFFISRVARGTAAAPTAVQVSDSLVALAYQGRGATGYSSVQVSAVGVQASENWTDSSQGTGLVFHTTPTGQPSSAAVVSLSLVGNTATFSGGVAVAGAAGTAIPGNADATGLYGPANTTMLVTGSNGQGTTIACNLYTSSGTWRLTAGGLAGSLLQMANTGLVMYSAPAGAAGGVAALAAMGSMDVSGNLTINGATATKASGTTWANPSARDLKEKIQPYSQGLQAVLALNPCTYEFVADSGLDAPGPHIGLIHDETAHMPEMHRAVTIGGSPGVPAREVDGLDCSPVTWALVNAIKELKAELDAVKAELDAVKAKLALA